MGPKLKWIKSSYSSSDGPSCVEVATPDDDRILVRDSENPTGPRLTLAPTAWARFLPYASKH
ncbi:DUF397 domain-containing protein [Streptomyces misionensis]|uniref:DUF397 domain-containing protein n=1 Tax=Streptomyces misionensis TaxID=67331 RepID=UPI0036C0B0E3